MFESLEQRLQLTLVPDPVTGVLTVNGTANADSLEITQGDGLVIVRNLLTGTSDQTIVNTAVTGIKVNLGAGDDYLRERTRYDTRQVIVGSTVSGGLGDDTIIGGDGRDNLMGE